MKRYTLREARKQLSWSQERLAVESGIRQNHISAIERGVIADPYSSTVIKLAAALGVDPRVLRFEGEDAS